MEQKKNERSGVVKTGAEKGGLVANNGVSCRCHTFQHLSIGIEQIVEVLRGGGLEVRSQGRANQILGMSTASIQSSLLLLIMSLTAILMVDTIGTTTICQVSGLFHTLTLPLNSTLK